jgi:hypothetical protein
MPSKWNPSEALSDIERAYAEKHGLTLADARTIVRSLPANRPLVEWYRKWKVDHSTGPSPEAETFGGFTLSELTADERARVRALLVDDAAYGDARARIVSERSAEARDQASAARLDLRERS